MHGLANYPFSFVETISRRWFARRGPNSGTIAVESETGNDFPYLPCIVFLIQRGTQDCFAIGADIDQPINETGDDVRSIKFPFDRSRPEIAGFFCLGFDFDCIQFIRIDYGRGTSLVTVTFVGLPRLMLRASSVE